MSVEEIEHELARLRMNEDGTLALRASVLNLIVVTDEDSAQSVTRSVSDIAGRYPSRAIVLISDPEEAEKNLEFQPPPSAASAARAAPTSAPSR